MTTPLSPASYPSGSLVSSSLPALETRVWGDAEASRRDTALLASQVRLAQQALADVQARLVMERRRNEEEETKVGALKAKLQNVTDAVSKLQEEGRVLEMRLNTMLPDDEEKHKSETEIQLENMALAQDVAEHEADEVDRNCGEMEALASNLVAQTAQAKRDAIRLADGESARKTKLKQKREKQETLEKEHDKLEQGLQTLKITVERLKRKSESVQEELDTVRREQEGLERTREGEERVFRETRGKLSAERQQLMDDISTAKDMEMTARRQKEEMQRKKREEEQNRQEREINQLQKEIEGLLALKTQLTSQIQEQQEALDKKERQKASIKEKTEMLLKEKERLKGIETALFLENERLAHEYENIVEKEKAELIEKARIEDTKARACTKAGRDILIDGGGETTRAAGIVTQAQEWLEAEQLSWTEATRTVEAELAEMWLNGEAWLEAACKAPVSSSSSYPSSSSPSPSHSHSHTLLSTLREAEARVGLARAQLQALSGGGAEEDLASDLLERVRQHQTALEALRRELESQRRACEARTGAYGRQAQLLARTLADRRSP